MIDQYTSWFSENYLELLGAVLGVLYIFFSIRQNILTWPTGLITSALYIFVFFQAKFYADMGLQGYYVAISIYGWYYWLKGGNENKTSDTPISGITKKTVFVLIPITIIIYGIILFILLNYTDSPVPYMDSMTTALSIVATWMLARKIIEHWLIWIFVDAFSAGLYVYKDLWPTTILFVIYTVMAIVGFYEWRKELKTT